ncbi:hypothetical protein Tco_0004615 [Tanacetum coccineum]
MIDAPPDIIDVDEDDDFIDDEDVLPHDLADSDDEDLVNDDDDDVAIMSVDVARGHGGDGGGDDRPPSRQIFTGCRGRGGQKPNRGGRKAGRLGTREETRNLGASDLDLPRTSSSQIGISRLTIGLMLRRLPEPFKMLKTRQRARSSAGRDPGHLLSSEICNGGTFPVLVGFWRDRAGASSLSMSLDARTPTPMSMSGSGSGGAGDDEPGEDEDADGSPRNIASFVARKPVL